MKQVCSLCIEYLVIATVLLMTMISCQEEVVEIPHEEQIEYKVAVVAPYGQQPCWKRVAEWAMDNIKESQSGMHKQISIQLEWHDEDNADLVEYMKKVAADTSYVAMIGPIGSDAAWNAAELMNLYSKTLILPVATSTELQRTYAGRNFLWCLSESDIAQCEMMLTDAKIEGADHVYLLSCDNRYGKTFSDWFSFQASEMGMEVVDMSSYEDPSQIAACLDKIATEAWNLNNEDVGQTLLFVPDGVESMKALDAALKEHPMLELILHIVCSDNAFSPDVARALSQSEYDYDGYGSSASPSSGFNTIYAQHFGEAPIVGEPQMYDAVLLLYYSLLARQNNPELPLSKVMLDVVDGRDKIVNGWLPDGIRQAADMLAVGGNPDLQGVSGEWDFDAKIHTVVSHSYFTRWHLRQGVFTNLEYLSTDSRYRTSSTSAIWNLQKTIQDFNPDATTPEYPALDQRWALIVATSTRWENYRHQADAFAMYQLLKRHGYSDDHIILIVSDTYAYSKRNPFQGQIFVSSDRNNVYDEDAIDYDFNDLSPEDLQDILCGHASDRLPKVINSDSNDNVLIFWSGHGDKGKLRWGEGFAYYSDDMMRETLLKMHKEQRYRRMLFAIEACYSGCIGERCDGIPGVLFVTAANAQESSKAELLDPELRIYLSNAFTRTFQESIDAHPSISLRDLYYNLALTTSGSHVTVYNAHQFGNIYKTSMSEFLE